MHRLKGGHMSIVKTHHDLVIREKEDDYQLDISEVVRKVTNSVLVKHPNLVSAVESGEASVDLLKDEVVKILDDFSLRMDREGLIQQIFSYMFGYGILQKLMEDEDVSDIIGTKYDYFTIKRNGITEKVDIQFSNEKEFERFCRLVVIRNGGIINENDSQARVYDANYRLRINVAIPPRNVTGSSISIRKHRQDMLRLDTLRERGMMNHEILKLIQGIVKKKCRLLISGKGGAGKTTLLGAILAELNEFDRILVCEKDRELYLNNPNIIIQKIKKRNEGGTQITLKDLITDGLTMSLDGYCIGELVGGEAWEFVKAGHTDHNVYGTIHANSSRDSLDRLEMLIGNEDLKFEQNRVRKVISGSLDYIIHMKEFKIVEIIELKGFYNNEPLIRTLVSYNQGESLWCTGSVRGGDAS